ncbi:hypothetical protein KEM48_007258 [Puccinia striiformis f. sp. tritici PST-130]|nr:hypothetical protein H4Q26_007230 [Puccinia striiformis f. sp. tritici PST-130]KAI9622367.1 hypothetical protein KEM48_007258 [Puccinia striiformis f. sp. tritici PST-130]
MSDSLIRLVFPTWQATGLLDAASDKSLRWALLGSNTFHPMDSSYNLAEGVRLHGITHTPVISSSELHIGPPTPVKSQGDHTPSQLMYAPPFTLARDSS